MIKKKVLLIAPKYFGYEKYIQNELRNHGAEVVWIPENLDNFSYKYRFIKNYIPNMFSKVITKYFVQAISKLESNSVDYVFVIRGEFLSKEILREMRNRFGLKCKFIMYQWDSVDNNPNALEISSFFDKVFTFDINDSKKYNWQYRPLFYLNKLTDNQKFKSKDVMFLGSLHSQRVSIHYYLKNYCQQSGLEYTSHIFSKKLIYYKRKYINKREEYVRDVDNDIKFKPLSLEECYDLYLSHKIIVDYTHPGQTGLTMRTIESLGCNCKLITNNRMVKLCDFYNPENIIVYEGENLIIPDSFFNTDYVPVDDSIKRHYSLKEWLEEIFGINM